MGSSRRLRIAVIAACPFPCPRGSPVRIRRQAEAMAARGHEVHVVTYHLAGEPIEGAFRIHRIPRVPTYRRLAPGPTWQKLLVLDPLLLVLLRRVLASVRFDVVHAHHYEGLLVAAAVPRRLRPPMVYDAHTMLASELPFYGMGLGPRMTRALGERLDRRLPRRASHVIAVTPTLRNRLLALGAVAESEVTVVGNGVEPECFAEARRSSHAAPTIVFAGNLAAYQGIGLLLRAMSLVRAQRPDARLRIVTQSSFAEHEELARELGVRDAIELVDGGFEALPSWLASSDVAVNPRTACDGLPQKVLNYMAAGLPIVSFAGSAHALLHGVTAWIAPDGDVEAMAGAILRLLDDPGQAAQLGSAAREHAMREHSWDRTAARIEEVYGRVLGEERPETVR